MPDRPPYGDPAGDREVEQRREQRRIAYEVNHAEISAGSIEREAARYWAAARAEQDPARRAGLEADARDADQRLAEAQRHLGRLLEAREQGWMIREVPPDPAAEALRQAEQARQQDRAPGLAASIGQAHQAQDQAREHSLAAGQQADPDQRAVLQTEAERAGQRADEGYRELGHEHMAAEHGYPVHDRPADPLRDGAARESAALERIARAREQDREAGRDAGRAR